MDTDLQSYLPWPMVSPSLGLLINSEGRVYLSGEGELFLLDENKVTVRCLLYGHNQTMVPFCLACSIFRRSDSYITYLLLSFNARFLESVASGEGIHSFWFWSVERRTVDQTQAFFGRLVFLHSSILFIKEPFILITYAKYSSLTNTSYPQTTIVKVFSANSL